MSDSVKVLSPIFKIKNLSLDSCGLSSEEPMDVPTTNFDNNIKCSNFFSIYIQGSLIFL